jgi:hypothetical protein
LGEFLRREPTRVAILHVMEVHESQRTVDTNPAEEAQPAASRVAFDGLVDVFVIADLFVVAGFKI